MEPTVRDTSHASAAAAPRSARVVAILAVKRLAEAKSRLAASTLGPRTPGKPPDRPALVLGMLLDTATALRAGGIEHIVVVSPDEAVLDVAVRAHLAGVRESQPTADQTALNQAFTQGIEWARGHWPDTDRIVLVQADLPAATGTSVAEVLRAAEAHPQAVLADREGTGTVLLVRPGTLDSSPRFGPDSAAAHRREGAVELDPAHRRWPDLRTDVDTAADLDAAAALGLGEHTSAVLRRRRAADGATRPPDAS